MIKSLEINNYKGIQNFKLDNLNRINIFVGNNNSGKTSLLEAGYIGMKDNYLGLKSVIQNRNMNLLAKTMETLFKDLDTNNKINIKIKTSPVMSIETEISLSKDNNIIPFILPNESAIQTQEAKKFIINKNGIKVEYNFAMLNRGGFFEPVMNIQNGSQQNKVGLSTPPQDIYYISSRTRTDMDFANELREQIKSRNEKKKILEELQIFDPKIEDIIVDGINIEVYLKGVDKPLPIQALGAGSFTVLEMASIFGREKIKNIFIDEIEDGLHIQSMEIIAKYLSKTMEQKPDLQLFITTHSTEIIKLITKHQIDKNIVSAYRIYNKNEKTQVVEYNEDLLDTLEEGWEIR